MHGPHHFRALFCLPSRQAAKPEKKKCKGIKENYKRKTISGSNRIGGLLKREKTIIQGSTGLTLKSLLPRRKVGRVLFFFSVHSLSREKRNLKSAENTVI